MQGLGRTGLKASRFGLGLAALGRPGYITAGRAEDIPARDQAAMQAQASAVLDAAHAAGITLLDAARGYGLAERFLGHWLAARGIAPGAVTVSSKWGYSYAADWQVTAAVHEVKELTLPRFLAQRAETLAELGGWLGLYQVHSLTADSPALDDPALLAALAGLKAEGVAVGFSTSGPAQAATIDAALERQVDGVRLFDCVQTTWNLCERAAGAALARAHAAGVGVIVKEALANGRLAGRPPEGAAWGDRLAGLAREAETGADALALAAVLAEPWADVVLLGAVTPSQIAENLAATRVSPALVAAVREAVPAQDPAAYWRERAALPWS